MDGWYQPKLQLGLWEVLGYLSFWAKMESYLLKIVFLFFFSFAGRNLLNSKISKMILNENVVNSKVVELIEIHNFGFDPFSI
jgi:hypothetical protein